MVLSLFVLSIIKTVTHFKHMTANLQNHLRKLSSIGPVVSEEIFENVHEQMDGRRTVSLVY